MNEPVHIKFLGGMTIAGKQNWEMLRFNMAPEASCVVSETTPDSWAAAREGLN